MKSDLQVSRIQAIIRWWFDKHVLSSDLNESLDKVGPAEGLTMSE